MSADQIGRQCLDRKQAGEIHGRGLCRPSIEAEDKRGSLPRGISTTEGNERYLFGEVDRLAENVMKCDVIRCNMM